MTRKTFSQKKNPPSLFLDAHAAFPEDICADHHYAITLTVWDQLGNSKDRAKKYPLYWNRARCRLKPPKIKPKPVVKQWLEPLDKTEPTDNFFADFLAAYEPEKESPYPDYLTELKPKKFADFFELKRTARENFYARSGLSPERVKKNISVVLLY